MPFEQPRVLIVDDDERVLETFAKALSLEGFTVGVAPNAKTGMTQVEAIVPDAILLDLRMPLVNGIGFLYRLRAKAAYRHTPVAVITGDAALDDDALDELRDLGAEVWFKPLWIDELVNVAKILLARRAAAPVH